jgi:hypothetical protein
MESCTGIHTVPKLSLMWQSDASSSAWHPVTCAWCTPGAQYELMLRFCSIAEHCWLLPVILATQQAEIRRIMVWNQPGQTVHETPSQKIPSTKKSLRSDSKCRLWVQSSPSTTHKKNLFHSWGKRGCMCTSEWTQGCSHHTKVQAPSEWHLPLRLSSLHLEGSSSPGNLA